MGRHFPVMSKRSCRSDLLIFQQMCCTITMYASYSVHSCRMAQDSTSEASVSGRQLWTNLYSRGSEMLNRSLLAVLNCLLLQKEKEKKRKGKNTFPIMILGIGMVELYESISHHLYSWTYCAPYVFLIWSSEGYIIITKCVTGARSV